MSMCSLLQAIAAFKLQHRTLTNANCIQRHKVQGRAEKMV